MIGLLDQGVAHRMCFFQGEDGIRDLTVTGVQTCALPISQVLAEVTKQGLDAVLVAVELALESAPPSGGVSTEHVINVLGRLQAQPLPETVATNLQVSQTPLADTARYDSLRAGSDMQEADHA